MSVLLLLPLSAVADGAHRRGLRPAVRAAPAATLAPEVAAEYGFERARECVRQIHAATRRMTQLQREARRRKDWIMLNCVLNQLIPAEGHVAESEQGVQRIVAAALRSDPAEASRQLGRVTLVLQKVLVLGAQAAACAGDGSLSLIYGKGKQQVEVEVDPSIPHGELTDPGLPQPNLLTMPAGMDAWPQEDSPPM